MNTLQLHRRNVIVKKVSCNIDVTVEKILGELIFSFFAVVGFAPRHKVNVRRSVVPQDALTLLQCIGVETIGSSLSLKF